MQKLIRINLFIKLYYRITFMIKETKNLWSKFLYCYFEITINLKILYKVRPSFLTFFKQVKIKYKETE